MEDDAAADERAPRHRAVVAVAPVAQHVVGLEEGIARLAQVDIVVVRAGEVGEDRRGRRHEGVGDRLVADGVSIRGLVSATVPCTVTRTPI